MTISSLLQAKATSRANYSVAAVLAYEQGLGWWTVCASAKQLYKRLSPRSHCEATATMMKN